MKRIVKMGLVISLASGTLYYCRQHLEAYFLAVPAFDEFANAAEIKQGQVGFGLTVFKNTVPEKFLVTFDGTISHPLNKKVKLVLVRMGYPLLNSNVLAGMSGSPVYFKQGGKWRLLGAVGFSIGMLSSGKSLGGVTPIEAMINQEKTVGISYVKSLQKANIFSKENILKNLNHFPFPTIATNGDHEIKMVMPAITMGAAKEAAKNQTLQKPKPGEAVAMVFVDGDYKLFATCTVTHVTENKFWACGHPFLGEGKTLIPAYLGSITTSLKSSLGAFKLPEGYKNPIGYINYDHVFAVEGTIAEIPAEAMIENNLKVSIGANKKASLRKLVARKS